MFDSERGILRWVILDGYRLTIAGLFLVGTFCLLVGLGFAGAIDVQNHDAVRGVAGGFVPGLIAFLSIVLGINQLVLSQEFGSAGEIRDRIERIREYRHDVEEIAGARPSPVLPVGFLSFLVRAIRLEAIDLKERVGSETDPDAREAVEAYAEDVVDESGRARRSLERLESGRINALLSVLEYRDAYQLHEARRLEYDHEETLPEEARQSLSRLIDALELFSTARTQFRTTYTQRVLARLSRQLLYVGIPALIAVIVLGLAPEPPRSPAFDPVRLVTVSALLSVGLSPLAVLSSYLLRVATVSERTVSAGPFVSRPSEVQTERDADSREYPAEGSLSTAETMSEDGNR